MRIQHHPRRSHGVLTIALACAAGLVLLGGLLAACGGSTTTTAAPAGGSSTTASAGASTTGSSAGTAGGTQVDIKNFAFNPASVTIKAGESVTWTNNDGTTHNIEGDNGEFKSPNMEQGQTFSFTFDKAGTIAYHCGIHPNMTATVIVQ